MYSANIELTTCLQITWI